MTRLRAGFAAWVRWWDRREPPDVLAVVRFGVGFVLLADLLTVGRLGLVVPLFVGTGEGGLVASDAPLWARWVGTGETGGVALYCAMVACSVGVMLGIGTRVSSLALMLLSAQWAQLLPDGDRAIDLQLRNVLMILGFSAAGDAWSVDAWWSTGSVRGSGADRPAWPRYLIVLQVVVMYFTAGVQKYAEQWWPWGGFSALYVILHDWSYAARPMEWIGRQPFYLGTQLSTALTLAWQWSYPVVLVHYFPPSGPPGRFRTTFARYRLHWLWIALGAFFHLLIAATMSLGIFPWGMLALYPAFLHPHEFSLRPGGLRRTSGPPTRAAP